MNRFKIHFLKTTFRFERSYEWFVVALRNSSLIVHHSSLFIRVLRNSSLITHRSSLFSHRSSLFLIFSILHFPFSILHSQHIDLTNVKDIFKAQPFKLNGGVSANGIYTNGTNTYGRDPFNYYLQGNLNLNIYNQLNLPFSFSFTNQGAGYTYPTAPNRLSLHPSYKWIHAHIGDVSMSFSPYTLAGHQFTGAGVDLTPQGGFRFSAMYGRLQKATSNNLAPGALPTYKRMGYGAKASYERSIFRVGMTAFFARDQASSLSLPPDSLLIYPKQNNVLSWDIVLRPVKNLRLSAEYAVSALSGNNNDSIPQDKEGIFKKLGGKAAALYNAWKAQADYTVGKGTLGLAYERVDPGYETLGGYYFNNDLQSIAITFSQAIWKERLSIAGNIGLQNDNLNNAKSGTTNRNVWSLSLGYTPHPKLQTSLNYSNFQTHMNMRDQFDYINQQSEIQYIDTLNFIQISQNASFTLNYITRQTESQNQSLNLNLSFQDASDEQGGVVTTGNSSQFYNMAATYHVSLPQRGISMMAGYNLSYNSIARNEILTMGPSVAFGMAFFKQRLTTGFTTAYNQSMNQGDTQNRVLNLRLNAAYALYKKHRINLSITNQYRNTQQQNARDLTAMLGYNYSF